MKMEIKRDGGKGYQELVDYLKSTREDEWCTGVTKNDKGQLCVINHIVMSDLFFSLKWHLSFTGLCEKFLFEINDGKHPEYQQETPRQRCIAFYEDLVSKHDQTLEKAWDYIEKKAKE